MRLLLLVALLACVSSGAAFAPISDNGHTILGASINVYDPEHGNQLKWQFSGAIEKFHVDKVLYKPGEWYYSVLVDRGGGNSKSYFFDSFTTLAGFRMQ